MESTRYRIQLNDAARGGAFRPLVFQLASTFALNGYVQNSREGLVIEVEGAVDNVAQFIDRLACEGPLAAVVTRDTAAGTVGGHCRTGMLTDRAMCADCLREILDPADRRYGYPFTECTACGPRFTITQRLPYERSLTTMRRAPPAANAIGSRHDPAVRST